MCRSDYVNEVEVTETQAADRLRWWTCLHEDHHTLLQVRSFFFLTVFSPETCCTETEPSCSSSFIRLKKERKTIAAAAERPKQRTWLQVKMWQWARPCQQHGAHLAPQTCKHERKETVLCSVHVMDSCTCSFEGWQETFELPELNGRQH